MGLNEFVDNFSMSIAGKLIKDKYFIKDVDSRKISDWFDSLTIDFPQFGGEGFYPVNVQYEGQTSDAGFRIVQWKGVQFPTIIYHHGAAEGSYDFSFNSILGKDKTHIEANLIAIKALFNNNNKEFLKSIACLSNYTVMLASSVMIVENIVRALKQQGSSNIMMTGISLGGFVANLHCTYFNTADCYRPLLSGARIAEVFIDSAYSKVTSVNGKANSEKLRHALNFHEDLKNARQDHLYPLLAKHDQIVRFDVQSVDFNPEKMTVIPYGHSTGATKFKLLRSYILKGIKGCSQ